MVWLYAGKLFEPSAAVSDGLTRPTLWLDMDLVLLYAFALTHQIRTLMNDVMTTIIDGHDRTSSLSTGGAITAAFQICGNDSRLCQFMMLEWALFGIERDAMPENLASWPAEFLAGALKTIADRNSRS